MRHSTRAIVLRTIKYSDNSVIAKIYTEKFGLQSYLVRGIRSKKSPKINLLSVLSLLEINVTKREKTDLHSLSELRSLHHFQTIPYDPVKTSLMLFMDEVIVHCIHEEEENPDLFQFLWDSIILLDQIEKGKANFHLMFLAGLSKYLGFYPTGNGDTYFDLREGIFTLNEPVSSPYLSENETQLLKKVYALTPSTISDSMFNRNERLMAISLLIRFYSEHVPGFRDLKGTEILSRTFND